MPGRLVLLPNACGHTIFAPLSGVSCEWFLDRIPLLLSLEVVMEITCHCGNVSIQTDTPTQLTECNCSICRRYATLWGYFNVEDVVLEIGDAGTESYIWGDQEIAFVRCRTCGCVTHYEAAPGVDVDRLAVNFRMLDVETVETIPRRYFNGRDAL